MGTLRDSLTGAAPQNHGEWRTTRQWAQIEKLGRCQAGEMIRRLVETGRWQVKRLPVRGIDGTIRQLPHYRPKPEKAA